MKLFSKRWLLGAAALAVVAAAVVRAVRRSTDQGRRDRRHQEGVRLGQGSGTAQRCASAGPPDPGERDQGGPEQGNRATPALQGQGQRRDRLVRPPRYLRRRSGARPRRQLRPQARQPRHRLPRCVQTVGLESPTPAQNPFGQAVVDFNGAPDFSPTRVAEPGPDGFPLKRFEPGAVARDGYSPFVRIAGSNAVYSAPIVATGDGPFDVVHHTNTGDRVLRVPHRAAAKPGQFEESWVDLLFVKGFDAGQPIVYISTDAGQPLTSVLERSTYVPALDKAAYNGGDDFLGSARERLFGFINGQTGHRQSAGAGIRPPDQGRPRRGRRQRRQHRADRRPAQGRQSAQRLRSTSRRSATRGTHRPTARSGTPSSGSGPTRPSGRASTGARSTRCRSSTSRRGDPTC